MKFRIGLFDAVVVNGKLSGGNLRSLLVSTVGNDVHHHATFSACSRTPACLGQRQAAHGTQQRKPVA